MQTRLIRTAGLISLALAFVTITPFVVAKPAPEQDAAIERLQTFANILAIVQDNYVEEVETDDLVTNALNGALESLDPHSHYVPLQEFEDRQKTARREYGGLGIEVVMNDDMVRIDYVIHDGPAFKAGIRAGDHVSAVAGESVAGKSLAKAVEGMRGLAGDPITVTVVSPNKAPREVEVIREVVQGRVVRHRVEDGLAYIRIETFNHPRLGEDVAVAIADLKKSLGDNLPGLVIDVRSNPGGLVSQTVKVAGHFLDGGEVFSARGRGASDTQRFNAEAGQLVNGVPIAVLTNSQSASAAEILAGAIQDRGRGIVVGRRSFGKGSVQSVIPLSSDNGALRLTTQRYYTPSGKSIQGRGILPDVLVAFRPDDGDTRKRFREDSLPNALQNLDELTSYEEDLTQLDYPPKDWPATEDYQLQQAIKLLKSSEYKQVLASQFTLFSEGKMAQ